MDYLQSRFNKESGFAIRQQIVYDRTLSLFEKYGIKNVVSKGYVLKKLYPNEEVRTMGDMDILISEENSKKTDEMLKENGYTIDNVFVNEIGYAKSGCAIEIHTSLMDDDLGNDFDYSSYFKEKSKYALPYRGEYTYVLKNEDHLIYLLAHIAKHFYNEGCGIRMIMDIAVFTKKYMSSLDWDYIFVKLKNISLTYNIPKKITKVADIQLSVSAQNLFTLTKYTGMDPEVYSESDYGFNGVDMGSYPVPRTFTFGMKLNF